ncbi:MAG: succinate dehydrogenase assembly factor 2 [Alphaproteobacteria bacterium]
MKIKRLIYQSWHRGCKETDEVLGPYASDRLSALQESEIALFEQLLEENDWDIWNWFTGKEPPKPAYKQLIPAIVEHLKSRP